MIEAAIVLTVCIVLGIVLGALGALVISDRAAAASDRRWERVVATQHAVETDLVTTAVYGGEKRAVAVREEPELTLEEEAQRQISEETIARGMAELRESYQRAGLTPDEDELRAEVIMLAMNIDPFAKP